MLLYQLEKYYGVMEDGGKLGERNWRNAARNRDSWQKLLKKALDQKGPLCKMMMMMMKMTTYRLAMKREKWKKLM